MNRIREKVKEQSAETLLEIVLSIALFGMTALMVAAMFGMANKVSMKNMQTDKSVDAMISDIVMNQNIDTASTVTQRIIFQKPDGSMVEHEVDRVKSGALYKFSDVP